MCLSPEFFHGRDALVLAREATGDVELEHFLKPRHVSLDRLHQMGLLKDDREHFSTADLFPYQVTAQGSAFMLEAEDYQLIFVSRKAVAAFGTFLNRAKRTKMGPRVGFDLVR